MTRTSRPDTPGGAVTGAGRVFRPANARLPSTALRPGKARPAGSVLADIVASVRDGLPAAKARTPATVLERRARDRTPRAELFVAALARPGRINVLAECKRRSPSAGVLRPRYRPDRIAQAYERFGAVAISVLTEPEFFSGALDHLSAVRRAVRLPVLRKDFIVDAYQLIEARAAGADAVLLIAAALDDRELGNLLAEARGLGLAPLVEVHDASDVGRAIDRGATLIGVNNRNLRTLEVDISTSERLVGLLPKGSVAVAESGIRSPEDVARLRAWGFDAFLIGEYLMTRPKPGEVLAGLLRAAEAAAAQARGDARCG
jgi:indole-3-glycerol phosphate synthase